MSNQNPIDEMCSMYDLSHDEALGIMTEAVGDVLGYKVQTDAMIDGRIVFYAMRDNGGQKTVRLSPLMEKRVRKLIEAKIDRLRMKGLKQQGTSIISATILEKNRSGLILSTKTGRAVAPGPLLIKEEEPFYQIGTKLDFHIHKMNDKNLVLGRRSKHLAIHILKQLLPKGIDVYGINRKFGKRLKVYANRLPEKTDLERIRMAFVEHIDFVMYDSADVENILKMHGELVS